MNIARKLTPVAAAVVLAAGCSTTPEQIHELNEAQAAVMAAKNEPMAERYAGNEIEQAEQALDRAEKARASGKDVLIIEHEAYIAHRYADLAEARIAEISAKEQIEKAELERSEVLRSARRQEAENAEQRARRSQIEADEAQLRAEAAIAAAQQMQDELTNLKAEQTERGLVLTLGDVLFDTSEASLKPGAQNTIQRLADFLNEQSDKTLIVEGHTDSRGSEQYNDDLSERRAESVVAALVSAGVPRDRLKATGMGEAYPVATNETSAGRQENRRVEVIIADDENSDGQLSSRRSDR